MVTDTYPNGGCGDDGSGTVVVPTWRGGNSDGTATCDNGRSIYATRAFTRSFITVDPPGVTFCVFVIGLADAPTVALPRLYAIMLLALHCAILAGSLRMITCHACHTAVHSTTALSCARNSPIAPIPSRWSRRHHRRHHQHRVLAPKANGMFLYGTRTVVCQTARRRIQTAQ